jgi:hypothetical protein
MPPHFHALELTILASVAASFTWTARRLLRRPPDVAAPPPARRALAFGHPFAQLLLVIALLLANQVLFNAYVRGAHRGDAWFAQRWVGAGWFDVAPYASPVTWALDHLPFPASWLSVTLFRVQAFLELPFVIFAYLAIARLLDRGVYRALARSALVWLACASFTAAFSWIEIVFDNPWTKQDLVLRAVSCLATPLWVLVTSRAERALPGFPVADGRPRSLVGILAFLTGATAIAALVLVVYDVTLLYNLAHLHHRKWQLVGAVAVALAAIVFGRRLEALATRARASDAVDTLASTLAIFTVVFFVPSLAVRYAGASGAALAGGTLTVVAAVAAGMFLALRRVADRERDLVVWLLGAAVGVAVGGWAAWTDVGGVLAHGDGIAETLLLRKAAMFLVAGIASWRALERAVELGERLVSLAARRSTPPPPR